MGSPQTTLSPISVLAGEALPSNRRIRFNGTAWVLCGASDPAEAFTSINIDNGITGMAFPANTGGTFSLQATGAITAGSLVYGAASGKVTATAGAGAVCEGRCLVASGGADDYATVSVEGAPNVVPFIAATAALTLTTRQSGSVITNLGASGAVLITLPQDAQAGCNFTFAVQAVQQLRITPGAAGAVYINGAKQADNKYVWADDEAESLTLVADGDGDWVAVSPVGTWGVEA